jgi:hypothetical protein
MFEILIEPAPTDGIFIFRNHLKAILSISSGGYLLLLPYGRDILWLMSRLNAYSPIAILYKQSLLTEIKFCIILKH